MNAFNFLLDFSSFRAKFEFVEFVLFIFSCFVLIRAIAVSPLPFGLDV